MFQKKSRGPRADRLLHQVSVELLGTLGSEPRNTEAGLIGCNRNDNRRYRGNNPRYQESGLPTIICGRQVGTF
jgi:hypothetical protein